MSWGFNRFNGWIHHNESAEPCLDITEKRAEGSRVKLILDMKEGILWVEMDKTREKAVKDVRL